jgi:ParB/RepB/Spo0J family partition protein
VGIPAKEKTVKTTLRDIAIEEIAESPHNPRRVYDEAALEELADSIREQGVLEPLLVRPRAQDPRPPGVFFPFELVAGHRRLRGARKAGLREVPCIVRELDDAQALEAALVENGHREDVTPLDEATAFARLMELGREVHNIADRIGRTPGYVRSRLRLLELVPEVRSLLESGRIHVGSALLLAQVHEKQQRELAERIAKGVYRPRKAVDDPWSSTDVSALLRDTQRRVSLAVWSLDDENLVPSAGPCTTCPRRSGSQRALLAEMEGEDQCLDAECWSTKARAAVDAAQKRGALVLAGPLFDRALDTGAFFDLDSDVDDQDFEDVLEDVAHAETWREALTRVGEEPSEWTLAVDHHGDVGRLVSAAHLADLVEDHWPEAARVLHLRERAWSQREEEEPARATAPNAPSAKAVEDDGAREKQEAERQAQREKQAREERARRAAADDLAAAIVAATTDERTTVDVWRAIVRVAIARADPAHLQAIKLRRELMDTDHARALATWVIATESTADLRGLLFEIVATPALRSQWLFEEHPSQQHGPLGIDRLLDAIGTNPGQVLARARKRIADEERAAEKAAVKAKASEAKKATKKARAAREVRDGA